MNRAFLKWAIWAISVSDALHFTVHSITIDYLKPFRVNIVPAHDPEQVPGLDTNAVLDKKKNEKRWKEEEN